LPAHRKEYCGNPTCGLPLSGENLYVSPKGRRGCRNCRARNNSASKVRTTARKLAAKAKATRQDSDRFAALVAAIRAELITLTPAQRAPYYATTGRKVTKAERAARRLANRRIPRGQLGTVTGLGDDGVSSTISQYLRRAQRAHAAGTVTPITMPLPADDGTWRIGDLALWRSAIWPKHALGNPGRWLDSLPSDQVLPVIEQAIAEYGRGIMGPEIRETLPPGRIGRARVSHLVRSTGLKAVQPGTPEGAQRAVQETLSNDGRMSTRQLADDYDVSPVAVRAAVKAGRLTPLYEGSRMYFDPAKVAARSDGHPGPVDADHPLALKPDRL